MRNTGTEKNDVKKKTMDSIDYIQNYAFAVETIPSPDAKQQHGCKSGENIFYSVCNYNKIYSTDGKCVIQNCVYRRGCVGCPYIGDSES